MQLFSREELKRNRAPRYPFVLVVFRLWKGEVREINSRTIPFPDKAIAHAAGRFVIVTRPAAIEVDLERPFRLRGNAFDEIVPESECARR